VKGWEDPLNSKYYVVIVQVGPHLCTARKQGCREGLKTG
jgi:hypothetical protein